MSEPNPLFYSRTQTCLLLQISLPTLERRISDGSIPCRRLGKRVLIPVSAIARLADCGEASK